MTFILDTHILIWHILGDKKLGKNIITTIENPDNMVFVSKASLWEIAIKMSLNKLKLSIPFEELENYLEENEYSILDYDFNDLKTLLTLPFHHSDPFDRLIIAQAITNKFTVITHDKRFNDYHINLY